MDLFHAMRVLLCVVEEGTFAAAARRLNVSPGVVTRHVQDLERSLAVRLLHRTTRRVSLTPAGEDYLQHARAILGQVQEAADQARLHTREVSGCLRVTTTSLVAVNLLAPCIAGFLQLHPQVQVDLCISDHPARQAQQFDLGIVRQDEHLHADVVVRPVCEMNYVLCGAVSYLARHGQPASPQELEAHRLVCLRASDARLPGVLLVHPAQADRRIEVKARQAVITNDDETAYQAALAGAGLTLLPELALTARPHGGQLRRVMAPWVGAEPIRLVATLPSRRFLPHRTRAFVEFFVRHVQEVAAAAGGDGQAAQRVP